MLAEEPSGAFGSEPMNRPLSRGQGFDRGWFFGQIYTRVTGSKVEMTVKEVSAPMGQGRSFPAEK
jgi:hypothetical protein